MHASGYSELRWGKTSTYILCMPIDYIIGILRYLSVYCTDLFFRVKKSILLDINFFILSGLLPPPPPPPIILININWEEILPNSHNILAKYLKEYIDIVNAFNVFCQSKRQRRVHITNFSINIKICYLFKHRILIRSSSRWIW